MLSEQPATADITAVVISGGTAANEILNAFELFSRLNFVLPVSDNGGSSAEIIRVLGGPSLGDIRSRLVRLISDSRSDGIKALFSYRLPSDPSISDAAIKQEWLDIVEGSHVLWRDIPADRREAIRAFLVHFEHAILRRAYRRFVFRAGSIGNFWLAGAQLFVRSLQSAIFLFSSVCGISSNYTVIPAINTNSLVTLAAELADGSRIVGQSEISHPSPGSAQFRDYPEAVTPSVNPALFASTHNPTRYAGVTSAYRSIPQSRSESRLGVLQAGHSLSTPVRAHSRLRESIDDDNLGVIARSQLDLDDERDVDNDRPTFDEGDSLRDHDHGESQWDAPRREYTSSPNIVFSKAEDGSYERLNSPISRVFYLNTYGQETYPSPASAYLSALHRNDVLIYCCGSLFTSLMPPLALTGVGNAIATSTTLRAKILLVNGSHDRESESMAAVDFVEAITAHLNNSISSRSRATAPSTPLWQFSASDYITHVIFLQDGEISVDVNEMADLGIKAVSAIGSSKFSDEAVRSALASIIEGL